MRALPCSASTPLEPWPASFTGIPLAMIERTSVEDSTFFHRNFDAIVAWGVLFCCRPAHSEP